VNLEFIAGLLQIVVIDLALSGDNAIVIGMAAASLPRSQRLKAIIVGGAGAIALRIILTAIATTLMRITLISAIAGAVLFWVAWKLLRMDVEEETAHNTRQAHNFRQAILLILTADFMMSLDNVLAVAGAAHGSYILLILGLLISMPLLMTTGGIISRLIDRFTWIPFVGAAVISFTAMRMILEDNFIASKLNLNLTVITLISTLVGLFFPVAIIVLNRWKTVKANAKKPLRSRPDEISETRKD
jgi:YjbE family integral membrane protein